MPRNGYKFPHSSKQDPISKILDKYKDHPCIKLIKAKNSSKFSSNWHQRSQKNFPKSWPENAA